MKTRAHWYPFTVAQTELALAVAGLGASAAALLGVPGRWVVAGTAICLAALFLSGAASRFLRTRVACVHLDAALHGRGYIRVFQQAEHSLLLMHIDDDVPNDDLLGVYRALLARGVDIHRLVFVRGDHRPEGIDWIAKFGTHPHLRQRLVSLRQGAPFMMSFAVVDDAAVLVAVPGFRPAETEPYTDGVVLRHLLELRDASVTRAFLEVYESAWRRAVPLEIRDA